MIKITKTLDDDKRAFVQINSQAPALGYFMIFGLTHVEMDRSIIVQKLLLIILQ